MSSVLGVLIPTATSGGSGGPAIDAQARTALNDIIHPSGTSIAAGAPTKQAGFDWFNPGPTARIVPSPVTEAAMLASGFVKDGPGSQAAPDPRLVSANTNISQSEHVIVENTAAATVTIAAGVTYAQVSRSAASTAAVTITSADGHTINADTSATLNAPGTVWLMLDETNFKIAAASQAGGSSSYDISALDARP